MSRSLQPSTVALVIAGSLIAGNALAQTREDPGDDGECATAAWAYDIDVEAVYARGDFTVNGYTPFAWASDARIELRSDELGTVDLGFVYTGGYTRWVIPGTYDVVFMEGGIALPANTETVLYQDMAINSSGIYDFDIPMSSVYGDVTMNGLAPPHSVYEWGKIELRDQETGARFPIGDTYDASIAALVVPGTYDVVYRNVGGGDWVPANKGAVIMTDVVITPGVNSLDVDVPAVEADGSFYINGTPPPVSVYQNGKVFLQDDVTGDLFELGDTRDRDWTKVIVPGSFDAYYERLLGGANVPANAHALVQTGVVVDGLSDADINIHAVNLEGDFLLDGIHFPGGVYNNAKIWLQGGNSNDLFEIGMTYEQSYSKMVVVGTYSVIYSMMLSTGVMPENDWALVSEGNYFPPKKGNAPHDFDVEVSSGVLSVDLTMWGEDPPPGVYQNGAILAVADNGDATLLGYSKDGGGAAKLVADDYSVNFSHMLGDMVPLNGDAPIGEGTAWGPFALPTQVDIQSGSLSGDFTKNSNGFPGLAGEVGRFSLVDQETGDVIDIGDSTAGAYSEHLIGRTYDVVYDYQSGNLVPANEGANLGCVTFNPLPPLGTGHDDDLTTR